MNRNNFRSLPRSVVKLHGEKYYYALSFLSLIPQVIGSIKLLMDPPGLLAIMVSTCNNENMKERDNGFLASTLSSITLSRLLIKLFLISALRVLLSDHYSPSSS